MHTLSVLFLATEGLTMLYFTKCRSDQFIGCSQLLCNPVRTLIVAYSSSKYSRQNEIPVPESGRLKEPNWNGDYNRTHYSGILGRADPG
jgi:hypothetical protein